MGLAFFCDWKLTGLSRKISLDDLIDDVYNDFKKLLTYVAQNKNPLTGLSRKISLDDLNDDIYSDFKKLLTYVAQDKKPLTGLSRKISLDDLDDDVYSDVIKLLTYVAKNLPMTLQSQLNRNFPALLPSFPKILETQFIAKDASSPLSILKSGYFCAKF